MFFTIRQTHALFRTFVARPAFHQNHMHFQSLVSAASEIPQDDWYLASEDPKLWKDYKAVGFDISGEFDCLAKNDCSD
jgi:hypothetical protein